MKNMLNKIIWLIKQLFYLDYYSYYESEKKKYVTTWKMWLGKCYNIKTNEIIV